MSSIGLKREFSGRDEEVKRLLFGLAAERAIAGQIQVDVRPTHRTIPLGEITARQSSRNATLGSHRDCGSGSGLFRIESDRINFFDGDELSAGMASHDAKMVVISPVRKSRDTVRFGFCIEQVPPTVLVNGRECFPFAAEIRRNAGQSSGDGVTCFVHEFDRKGMLLFRLSVIVIIATGKSSAGDGGYRDTECEGAVNLDRHVQPDEREMQVRMMNDSVNLLICLLGSPKDGNRVGVWARCGHSPAFPSTSVRMNPRHSNILFGSPVNCFLATHFSHRSRRLRFGTDAVVAKPSDRR
ncbi:MAG: hypothetical protein HY290_13300 [Planctomycetia bacterium]|nr:hypothetical protein [Planctomycetia bacterium]